ncbi:hypothetical protein [Leptospira andrefontaineae]|uniref:Uncharacterized protein n=1 Tax=Leptospira andrefontaineae TaxID=2484976 RepID=A0A4R9H6W4_9LEPT|nr:hypothetical protein [Leptospira andrefontaineae]TGK41257.1 hypothetical protein EHO65_07465 [Leptospira andrefontaineae]
MPNRFSSSELIEDLGIRHRFSIKLRIALSKKETGIFSLLYRFFRNYHSAQTKKREIFLWKLLLKIRLQRRLIKFCRNELLTKLSEIRKQSELLEDQKVIINQLNVELSTLKAKKEKSTASA